MAFHSSTTAIAKSTTTFKATTIVTYEEIRTKTGELVDTVVGKEEEKPKGNVW